MIDSIIHGDCLEVMRGITHKSVDMILTDPPYNVSQKSNFHTMGRKGVDFGEWDKEFNQISWIKPAISTLKDGANIIIFNDWKNMSYIKDELETCGCLIKQMVIWEKSNPMPRNRERLYVTSCEFAIWATKGKGWTYNRQRRTYENAVFTYPIVGSKKRFHPTQKPIELIRDLINIHTNENDVILDPFVGSGTTAIAAINTNRHFIGIEQEERYVDISRERVQAVIASIA